MNADGQGAEAGIAGAILEHLRHHPQAADSAEGVARWWLKPPHNHASVEDVEQALEALVDRRVLRCLRLTGGGALYSLDQPLPPRQ